MFMQGISSSPLMQRCVYTTWELAAARKLYKRGEFPGPDPSLAREPQRTPQMMPPTVRIVWIHMVGTND